MGKNAARVAEIGGRVYLDYLLKLYRHVSAKGKRVNFWADIIAQHPDLVPELPKDIIPLVWGYEDTEPSETQCQMVTAPGCRSMSAPAHRAGIPWRSGPIMRWVTCVGRRNMA